MEKLNTILCEVLRLSEEDIVDTLTMSDVERWDSLTHMDLVTSIEQGLGIEFSMDDIISMKDVMTIRTIVESLQ